MKNNIKYLCLFVVIFLIVIYAPFVKAQNQEIEVSDEYIENALTPEEIAEEVRKAEEFFLKADRKEAELQKEIKRQKEEESKNNLKVDTIKSVEDTSDVDIKDNQDNLIFGDKNEVDVFFTEITNLKKIILVLFGLSFIEFLSIIVLFFVVFDKK